MIFFYYDTNLLFVKIYNPRNILFFWIYYKLFLFLLSSSQYFIIWRSLFYFINVQLFKNCLLSFYNLLYFKQIIINSKSNSITFHSFQFTHNFCPKFFSIQRYLKMLHPTRSERKQRLAGSRFSPGHHTRNRIEFVRSIRKQFT